MADKIIRNSKLDTFLSKLATKLTAIFWRKAETTQVSVDSTPTANSNNLVKSGGVKSYVDNAIPTVPDDLDDLSDVNLGTPSDGDVLTYDSTTQKWVADEPQGGELSTDVVTDRTDNTKASTPKSVYDFVKPVSQSTIPSGGLLPGVLYNLGALTGSVTIDLATPVDSSVANEYVFTFNTSTTVPTITWPSGITWVGNCLNGSGVPALSAGSYYEVSIMNSKGVIIEW